MRVQYGDLLAETSLLRRLGVCSTDTRLLSWTNTSQRRLLKKGRYWGAVAEFRICAQASCITLPPQLATIEAVNQCGRHVDVHDFWWKYLQARGGGEDCFYRGADMVGNFPTFSSINTANDNTKTIKVVADSATDNGVVVVFYGYDQNGNWIRTVQNAALTDGFAVSLANGGGTTASQLVTRITDIQIPGPLAGQWWLYEHDTTTNTDRLIGHYQYWETRPSYRRYRLPQLSYLDAQTTPPTCACNENFEAVQALNPCTGVLNPSGIQTASVDIQAKMEYVPIYKTTDYLILGNLDAMAEMMSGLKQAEDLRSYAEKAQAINAAEVIAMGLLDDELDHYLGAGRRNMVNFIGSSNGDISPVPVLI